MRGLCVLSVQQFVMRLKKFLNYSIFCLICTFGCYIPSTYAQVDGGNDFSREVIWGLNKNTNGGLIGGGIIRVGISEGRNIMTTYGLEISNVKHANEHTHRAASSFVFGKQNYLYAIRLQYGKEKLLFRKASQQGVQISIGAAAGPTIGLESPYYILTDRNTYEKFDPEAHDGIVSIQGSGRLFQGLGESKIIPGGNAKIFVNFEFGAFKNNVTGLEIGTMFEAYSRKVIIMGLPADRLKKINNAIFPSLYFNLYWGTRR